MSLPSCKPFLAISFCPISPMLCAISPSIQWLASPTTLLLLFIFNVSLLISLLYIAYLFARHLVANLCAVSNICCHARPCPRAYFCQHPISIPCVPRSMGSFPISLCRHKVKHFLFSKPTLDIENLVKRKNRTLLPLLKPKQFIRDFLNQSAT